MFPIAPSCWPFLSTFLLPLPFLGLSSDNPPVLAVVFLVFCNLLVSLSVYSHLSPFILNLTLCPALFTRLLFCQLGKPRFQSLLSILFTPAILLIQLFSHTCSLHCCCSDRATVSNHMY